MLSEEELAPRVLRQGLQGAAVSLSCDVTLGSVRSVSASVCRRSSHHMCTRARLLVLELELGLVLVLVCTRTRLPIELLILWRLPAN